MPFLQPFHCGQSLRAGPCCSPRSGAARARAATLGLWADSGQVLACSYKNKLVSNKCSFWTKCGSQQSGNLHCIAMYSAELLQSLV